MKHRGAWDSEQEANGIPMIERTYKAKRPNGEAVRVNCFDYNLAYCADKTSYIQCSDGSWMRIDKLTIVSN